MREGPPSSIIVLSILLCIYIVHALLVLRPTVNESRITIVQTGGLWARGHGTRKEVEQPSTKPATRAKELLTPHQQHPHICSSALRQIGHLSRKQYKLMIIVAETSDRKGRAESLYIASNFQQYCQRHGYLFKHHFYNQTERYGVFATKWAHLHKFWEQADWLLLVDSDSLVVNMSRSFDPFLQDSTQHVLLQLRPRSREVDAAAVALRSSEFSRCFLEHWLAVYTQTKERKIFMNNDNGPLLQTVLDLLAPDMAAACFGKSNYTTYDNYRRCWEGVFPLLSHAHELSPVKVYMPLAGFLREHIGADAVVRPPITAGCTKQALEQMLMQRCWSNDLIVSGWKQIGAGMWAGLEQNASLARCHFNTLEEELVVARTACFVEYPGCYSAGGLNICRQQPHCSVSGIKSEHMRVRLDIGFGLPRLDVSDPVWQPVWPSRAECLGYEDEWRRYISAHRPL